MEAAKETIRPKNSGSITQMKSLRSNTVCEGSTSDPEANVSSEGKRKGSEFSNAHHNPEFDPATDDDEEDNPMENIARIYLKLPPPRIPMIPFNKELSDKDPDVDSPSNNNSSNTNQPVIPLFFPPEEDSLFRIETREEFAELKQKVHDYVFEMDRILYNTFQQMDSLGENHAQNKSNAEQNDNNQPTAIQLLKTLEKADSIILEIERSRKETEEKQKLANASL